MSFIRRPLKMPAHLPRKIIKGIGLLIAILTVVMVLIALSHAETSKLSTGGVLALSLDVLCLLLGIFIYANMASLQGRSGWFLLLFFLNHLLLAADSILWIYDGDPQFIAQHARLLTALYLCDLTSAPVFVLLTRQVTSGVYSFRELFQNRTKLDIAEAVTTCVCTVFAVTILCLNGRFGTLFYIDDAGFDHFGKFMLLFCVFIATPQFLCLIRISRSKISFEKILPLLLFMVLPLVFIALDLSGRGADMVYALIFIVLLATFGQFFSEIGVRNEKMKDVLGTYVSEDVVKYLLEEKDGREGKKYTATVLLTDLRGFTSTSGQLSTEDTVAILNHWLSEMSGVIRELNGTVTEFLGDGFLCVFGAPMETDDHADRAVAAALRMQQKTEEASRWNREHGYPPIRMGIGLSSGELLFGSFGTKRVARLMAIGTPVNRAFAAEEKTLGGQILITPETKAMLHASVDAELIEKIGGMQLYSVTGIKKPWDLQLERNREPLKKLEKPIRVRICRLEGKDTVLKEFYGTLKEISTKKAAILTEQPLEPFEQIRFNMEEGVKDTVYARTGGRLVTSDEACIVDITVCPRSLEDFCTGDGV